MGISKNNFQIGLILPFSWWRRVMEVFSDTRFTILAIKLIEIGIRNFWKVLKLSGSSKVKVCYF
jgi:hypothetical protein